MESRAYKSTLIVAFLLVLVSLAQADDSSGKIVGVLDGDTIEVMHEGKADQNWNLRYRVQDGRIYDQSW